MNSEFGIVCSLLGFFMWLGLAVATFFEFATWSNGWVVFFMVIIAVECLFSFARAIKG